MSTVTSQEAELDLKPAVRAQPSGRGGAHALRKPRPGVSAMLSTEGIWTRAALAFLLALAVSVALAFLVGHAVGG